MEGGWREREFNRQGVTVKSKNHFSLCKSPCLAEFHQKIVNFIVALALIIKADIIYTSLCLHCKRHCEDESVGLNHRSRAEQISFIFQINIFFSKSCKICINADNFKL